MQPLLRTLQTPLRVALFVYTPPSTSAMAVCSNVDLTTRTLLLPSPSPHIKYSHKQVCCSCSRPFCSPSLLVSCQHTSLHLPAAQTQTMVHMSTLCTTHTCLQHTLPEAFSSSCHHLHFEQLPPSSSVQCSRICSQICCQGASVLPHSPQPQLLRLPPPLSISSPFTPGEGQAGDPPGNGVQCWLQSAPAGLCP